MNTSAGVASAPSDQDWQLERQEWLESLQNILDDHGPDRARELMALLHDRLERVGVTVPPTLNTPYRNTIPVEEQPRYPGDVDMEQRIENIIRWNALAMVLQANDNGSGVGGHIATYASAATMLEVGFNHFFRARSEGYGGDMLNVQAHASPGVYARAFLEGRLNETQLANFRRELQAGGGLSSYPHPRNMPNFWEMPTASMGLSTVCSIYQARFARYLENRGLKPRNGGKVWTFIGDGEADEPEVLGTIGIAAREKLDNLVLVVNCNLQRLDGPVRGNSKIIQELERVFLGAGWNVIKVIWGSPWDAILARDVNGVLLRRMERAVDGDYQRYSVLPGDKVREHWVKDDPELVELMKTLSDEEIRTIKRGGYDHFKLYAAFHRAAQGNGKPTVILAKSIKGYGLTDTEGKNTAHQKKKMSDEERIECARRFGIPLADGAIRNACFYRPPEDSPERRYLQQRRETLGGYLPARQATCPSLPTPARSQFENFLSGSDGRAISTTMVMVRMLAKLMRDPGVGKYIVPIVPDEARTFGMDGLFPQAGIYSPEGQRYTPVDADTILPYKESTDGQILQEGICEAGAMASFLSAGTAYAQHGVPTIPFYIFYSIFGFQRVGDLIWACGDSLCRGFLLGGTSGRTTLNGEGLQHQDGHSQVVASTVPSLLSYDPAFAFELAVIVREGIRRMYTEQENIFYYITVTNENTPMPAMPEGVEEGILKGLYRFRPSEVESHLQVHLLGSGPIMYQVLEAQGILARYGVAADIWSVTSYNELYRDAMACERWNRLHPDQPERVPYVTQALQNQRGCFIAASDYMKVLSQRIANWVPGPLTSLGTDGFGLSESRPDLRDHFEVSAAHIALAALHRLAQEGNLPRERVKVAINELEINPEKRDPVG